MHQIRQKKPKPSKRNATGSSIAPSIDDRADERCASDERTRQSRSTIAPRDLVDRADRSTIVPRNLVDRDCRLRRSSARCDRRRSGAIWALSSLSLSLIWALSLSLSLFFQKLFEVKMRGETDFRVKGENIGQPEVIFRKMIFSVTAKHAEKGENDFPTHRNAW